jgi:hypothetical protein
MTQRQFFFIFIIRSKGRERKGGKMIAFKPIVSVVLVAFPPALFRAAIPNH